MKRCSKCSWPYADNFDVCVFCKAKLTQCPDMLLAGELENKAELMAGHILLTSLTVVDTLCRADMFSSSSKEKQNEFYREFVIFSLYTCDRMAYDSLGRTPERELFMNSLLENILSIASEHVKTIERAIPHDFCDNFLDLYIKRQEEYSALNIFSEKGKGPKGTLLWEFGKKISDIITGTPDIGIIMATCKASTEYLIALKSVVSPLLSGDPKS